MALGVEFAGDFADAEIGMAGIAGFAAGLEGEIQGIKVLRANLRGLPEPRIRDLERCEVDHLGFVRGQLHGLRKFHLFDLALQHALDRVGWKR